MFCLKQNITRINGTATRKGLKNQNSFEFSALNGKRRKSAELLKTGVNPKNRI